MHFHASQISLKIQGFFLLLILLSSCAVSKFKIDKTPLTQYFETNPVFRESHSGLLIFDPADSSVVFDYNSHRHFTPASNTKLLTYFAATKMMGDSIPALKYCIVNDSLFFTGTGDPTFLNKNVYKHIKICSELYSKK